MSLGRPLTLWTTFVLVLATLGYTARFSDGPPANDVLYRWSSVAEGALQFAIVLVGVFFALAHGLVEAFPFLAALGAMLAYLRSRVDSVVPGMIVHALFNVTALVIAVAG